MFCVHSYIEYCTIINHKSYWLVTCQITQKYDLEELGYGNIGFDTENDTRSKVNRFMSFYIFT